MAQSTADSPRKTSPAKKHSQVIDMLIPGLVSVTFRNKAPEEICALCQRAGLKAIEWGGDVHAPDEKAARAVGRMSRDAGLFVCSYGSYFRVGGALSAFERNLDAAAALGAPAIRVWLGEKGSAETDEPARAALVKSLAEICRRAEARGIVVAPEFHGGTLTDDLGSVARLLDECREIPNLRFYWQPRWDWPEADRLRGLEMALPRLLHVHAFTWRHGAEVERLPLAAGEGMWKKALNRLENAHVLLEFVEGDDEAALLRDARTLIDWIS